ncbi:MAG: glycosyltransferase family 1 protein, partial [Pyrinomonadaceae bacterium]
MRILVATVQTPFVRGGAEALVAGLVAALRAAGNEAEATALPFKWYPPERILDAMLAARLLDVSEVAGARVDLVVGVRFPAYLVPHANKVLWLAHQHRPAYDLWDEPLGDLHNYASGARVRDAVRHADRALIPEARRVFTISRNVSAR